MDLVTEWRARRWRRLLNCIDHLPRTSAYIEAISQDEELAEQELSRKDKDRDAPGRPRGPRISEYDAQVEMLTNIFDRLGEVMQATIAAAGSKPPKVKPYPRPQTAGDRVRERRGRDKHRRTVARVMIEKPDGSTVPLEQASNEARPAAPVKPLIEPGEDPYTLTPPRRRR